MFLAPLLCESGFSNTNSFCALGEAAVNRVRGNRLAPRTSRGELLFAFLAATKYRQSVPKKTTVARLEKKSIPVDPEKTLKGDKEATLLADNESPREIEATGDEFSKPVGEGRLREIIPVGVIGVTKGVG